LWRSRPSPDQGCYCLRTESIASYSGGLSISQKQISRTVRFNLAQWSATIGIKIGNLLCRPRVDVILLVIPYKLSFETHVAPSNCELVMKSAKRLGDYPSFSHQGAFLQGARCCFGSCQEDGVT